MNTWHRASWSLLIIGILAIVVRVLLNSALLVEKSANPSLNKAAVGPNTPYIVLGMGCFWGGGKTYASLSRRFGCRSRLCRWRYF